MRNPFLTVSFERTFQQCDRLSGMAGDLVGLIEAVYDMDGDDGNWVRGIVERARPLLDHGLGIGAFTYDATEPGRLRASNVVLESQIPKLTEATIHATLSFFTEQATRSTFLTYSCALAVATNPDPGIWKLLQSHGIHDCLNVNGVDPSGHGVLVAAMLPSVGTLAKRSERTWSRVGSHLAAGYRLRRRLRASASSPSDDVPEAVLRPNGVVEHAELPAQSAGARVQLREAVRGLERARGTMRRRDPDGAVAEWRGFIATRRSLLEHFETDGKRYLLAQRNDPPVADLGSLSTRERQAIAYASLGHNNKLIAYEMGISPSTVGVLLHRARTRLRVGSRAALLDLYRKAEVRNPSDE